MVDYLCIWEISTCYSLCCSILPYHFFIRFLLQFLVIFIFLWNRFAIVMSKKYTYNPTKSFLFLFSLFYLILTLFTLCPIYLLFPISFCVLFSNVSNKFYLFLSAVLSNFRPLYILHSTTLGIFFGYIYFTFNL